MVEIKDFETLYQIDKKNKTREWKIQVKNNIEYSDIIITHGGDNCRKIESINKIIQGKNLGKKNETTHYQQACKEALSKWTKKRDIEGYRTTKNNQQNQQNQEQQIENVHTLHMMPILPMMPMLANDYHKQKSKLQFPAYIQPKLDGYRMIYNSNTESILSRQGKSFDIVKESNVLMKELKQLKEYVFDGELYVHGGIFEHLGLLRKKKSSITDSDKINLEKLEYHIYDIIEDNHYTERYNKLKEIIGENFTKIKLIKCIQVNNETEIKNNHSQFLSEGYEGSMLRNQLGGYKCKYRSNNLLKYKDFIDSEHPITGYSIETDTNGNDEHLIVWLCKNENGEFSVRPKGSHIERKRLYKECVENFDKYKGKMLWCKYFELTERGVPRFPTTMRNTVSDYIRNQVL